MLSILGLFQPYTVPVGCFKWIEYMVSIFPTSDDPLISQVAPLELSIQ